MTVSNKNGVGHSLAVLLVEDSEADAALLVRALQKGGFKTDATRVDTPEALETALQKGRWDLILSDHSMPLLNAPQALEIMKAQGLDLPFIIVSGHIDEETAVTAMRAGAHDYIMKDRLARLCPAVERELREAEVRRARRQSEIDLRRAHDELEQRVEQRTADLQTAKAKLEAVLEERRRLETELLEIAENERRRIGFDLHDDLGQRLTGISLMVAGLEHKLQQEKPALADEAHRVHDLITEVIHHTHNLAHQCASLDAQGTDLASQLKDLGANVKKMFQLACGVTLKGSVPELPSHTSTQLYKIAQEAVSNGIKHGKAKHLSITLTGEATELILTIRNDGHPFVAPSGPRNRMGLRIMNYRANTINARVDIKAGEKGGAVVTCVLPLDHARPGGKGSASADSRTPKLKQAEPEPVLQALKN